MTRNEEYRQKFAAVINEYFGTEPTPPDAHTFVLSLMRDLAIMLVKIEADTNYKTDA